MANKNTGTGCCGVLVLGFLIIIGLVIWGNSDKSSPEARTYQPDPTPESSHRRSPMKPNTTAPEPESKQSEKEKSDASSEPKKSENGDSASPSEKPRSKNAILLEEYEREIREDIPFTAPKVGDEVSFRIDDGQEMKGKIYRLTKKNIRFGSEDLQMTLDWDRLVLEDRLRLDQTFYENYVKEQAFKQASLRLEAIEKEKRRVEAQAAKIRIEQAKKQAQEEAERRIQENASKFRRKFEAYYNGSNAILPVVIEVKSRMNDPDSFEHVKTDWYILKGTSDQYLVRMYFRGKNALGAKVLNGVEAVCWLNGTVASLKFID